MAIFFFGDSYTYGDELADPATQSYPAIASKELSCLKKNCGKPGASNDEIVRKLLESVNTFGTTMDGAVIGWSSPLRFEHWDQEGPYTVMPNSAWPGAKGKFASLFIKESNLEWFHQRMVQQMILAQSFLEARQIPYLMFFTYPLMEYCEQGGYNTKMLQLLNTEHFLDYPRSLLSSVEHLPFMPKNHPGPEAHAVIGGKIAREIEARQWLK